MNGCKKFVKSVVNYCSNIIERFTPKTNGYKSSQGGQTTKSSSGSSISTPEVPIRDVTYEVNCALKPYVNQAKQMRKLANIMPLYEPYIYGTFGMLVNHYAAWDIKRKESWEQTICTTYPGQGTQIMYGGILMTPECLGNYTYGYLGAAFGIPYQTLIDGSVFAAKGPSTYNSFQNEVNDWNYIKQGYLTYYLL